MALLQLIVGLAAIFNPISPPEATFKNNHGEEGFLTFFDATDEAGGADDLFFATNAYPARVELTFDDKTLTFSCSENAYHALKYYPDFETMDLFTAPLDGFEGYALSRDPELRKRIPSDWYPVQAIQAMLRVVRAKFSDPVLKEQLLSTGGTYLVEHWPKRMDAKPDTFWANGGDGSGFNVMGLTLMHVRGELGGVGHVRAPLSYYEWLENAP